MLKQLLFFGISIYLAFTFTMAGANKLVALDAKTHEYIVGSSKYWVDVFAPLFNVLSFTPSADGLRKFLGVSELLGAAALAISAFGFARCLGNLAAFGLMVIMAGAIYLHNYFNTSIVTPAIIFGLIVLRFLVAPSCKSSGKVKTN